MVDNKRAGLLEPVGGNVLSLLGYRQAEHMKCGCHFYIFFCLSQGSTNGQVVFWCSFSSQVKYIMIPGNSRIFFKVLRDRHECREAWQEQCAGILLLKT